MKVKSYKLSTSIHIFFLFFFQIILFSCGGLKSSRTEFHAQNLNKNLNKNQFTGVLVIDPVTMDTIYQHHSSKYFIPASNTKIFTLLSALKTLPEQVPGLTYIKKNDTLFAQGTGNPSLLHPYFKDSSAIKFLKKHANIAFNFSNFTGSTYGPGWAWEDYDSYFSPEKNAFPMYGNVLTISNKDGLSLQPTYFMDSVVIAYSSKRREQHKNLFYWNSKSKGSIEIPFITSKNISRKILESVLNKKIRLVNSLPAGNTETLYSIPADSIYKRMMHTSDNFLAEQLMLMSSGILKDTLNFSIAKKHILETYFNNLKQQPRWVDGSGLSRYNLFTPESLVQALHLLYKDVPKELLLDFFPAIHLEKKQSSKKAYLYAKTGSMGNTYCLSGYLITRSGKTFIFSFMNNHFRIPTAEVKENMRRILNEIHKNN